LIASRGHRPTRRFLAFAATAAVAAALIVIAPSDAAAGGESANLFSIGPDVRTVPRMLRSRTATLERSLTAESGPMTVTIDLFDDTAVTVALTRTSDGDSIVWTGAVAGRPGTSVLIVSSGGHVFGNAHLGDQGEYVISDRGDGTLIIAQADPSALGVEVGPIPMPALAATGPTATRSTGPRGGKPKLDVMILWSAQVLDEKFGGDPGLGRAWASTRIAELNTVFHDSGIDAKARLAYAGTAAYDAGSDYETSLLEDLKNFTYLAGQDCDPSGSVDVCDPEGRLDTERTQRALVGADLAVLVVDDSDEYGIAWSNCRPDTSMPVPNVGAGTCNADYGFAVVEYSVADTFYSIDHEIGHLLGSKHDAANGGDDYARGYKVSGKFSTVVAYECEPPAASNCAARVGFYSNPEIIWPGDGSTPMGEVIGNQSPTHADDGADNASHFAVSIPAVAAFFDPVRCKGATPTILGTAGNDTIDGTAGDDVILGFGGEDTITAKGGKDLVCAGGGDDEVSGGGGADRIYGGSGSDLLEGDAKSDQLYGGGGGDTLKGGPGQHDLLNGNGGIDTLDGGPGDADSCRNGETYRRCETIL
jgi:hypothetical protein